MSRIILTTIGSFGDLHPKIAIAQPIIFTLGSAAVMTPSDFYQQSIQAAKLLKNPNYAAKAAEIGRIIQAEDGVGIACDAIEKQLQAV